MALIKQYDKRCGITYVYESTSYWDKEKHQPRAKRKLIGRLDEETGEIIPTSGRGRKKAEDNSTEERACVHNETDELRQKLAEKDIRIHQLEAEITRLEKERQKTASALRKVLATFEED